MMEFALELNCEPVGRWCGPVVDNKESLSHRFPRLDDHLDVTCVFLRWIC